MIFSKEKGKDNDTLINDPH